MNLQRFLPDLSQLTSRFPVPTLASVLAFLVMQYGINGPDKDWIWRIVSGLILAFFVGGATHLFAEGRGLPRAQNWLIAAVLAVAAFALGYFATALGTSLLFAYPAAVMALFIAAFLRRDATQGAMWMFGMRLVTAAVIAFIVGIVLMLGLFAILSGLKFLFGIEPLGDMEGRIFMLAALLVAPLYGLSLVPTDLREEIDFNDTKSGLLERGVSVLVSYVMVPVAFIYALMLHAYAVKIIGTQSLPKGEIATIVSLFAIGGTLTWLVSWPMRETGVKLLQMFHRFWFLLLPAPVVLLSIAIWRRVSEYGITPDRYGIALVAIWTALVFSYLLVRRKAADMRVLIGAAAVLLLGASFGPFGAYGMTANSQYARFVALMERNGMLQNGLVVKPAKVLTVVQKTEGVSVLQALVEVGALNRTGALLAEADRKSLEISGSWIPEETRALFGLNETFVGPDAVQFRVARYEIDQSFAVPSRVLGALNYSHSIAPLVMIGPDVVKMHEPQGSGVLLLDIADPVTKRVTNLTIPIKPFLEKMASANASINAAQSPLEYAIDANHTLLIIDAEGSLVQTTLRRMTFWIVQKR